MNFLGAPLVPGIGKLITPVSVGIVELWVKVVMVGGGVIIAIELDGDPDGVSGKLDVSEIGLEVVLGVLEPVLSSRDIKGLGEC